MELKGYGIIANNITAIMVLMNPKIETMFGVNFNLMNNFVSNSTNFPLNNFFKRYFEGKFSHLIFEFILLCHKFL